LDAAAPQIILGAEPVLFAPVIRAATLLLIGICEAFELIALV
jgi:hypothetical protein